MKKNEAQVIETGLKSLSRFIPDFKVKIPNCRACHLATLFANLFSSCHLLLFLLRQREISISHEICMVFRRKHAMFFL